MTDISKGFTLVEDAKRLSNGQKIYVINIFYDGDYKDTISFATQEESSLFISTFLSGANEM